METFEIFKLEIDSSGNAGWVLVEELECLLEEALKRVEELKASLGVEVRAELWTPSGSTVL
jgi:hypothetical protein